jgi:hypothetical protein
MKAMNGEDWPKTEFYGDSSLVRARDIVPCLEYSEALELP